MDQNNNPETPEIRETTKTIIAPLTDEEKAAKNVSGSLGAICNNCGGIGWTMILGGGKKNCESCDMTGIATMSRRELQDELMKTKRMIKEILQHLVDEGIILKGLPREGANV